MLLTVSAPAASAAEAVSQESSGLSTLEIAIFSIVMFTAIAVFGVLFLRVVQKDRSDIRGIRRK